MARRKNVKRNRDEIHTSHSRKRGTKNQRKLILIACEGSKTEPKYFQDYFAYLIRKLSISPESFVIHIHTDPSGAVFKLVEKLNKLVN